MIWTSMDGYQVDADRAALDIRMGGGQEKVTQFRWFINGTVAPHAAAHSSDRSSDSRDDFPVSRSAGQYSLRTSGLPDIGLGQCQSLREFGQFQLSGLYGATGAIFSEDTDPRGANPCTVGEGLRVQVRASHRTLQQLGKVSHDLYLPGVGRRSLPHSGDSASLRKKL
ncbi:hypothetical protein [Streptomyces sp. CB03234]|uniref:hypothetical protein n=1 Tax=Streptomyces sp. (strain CB03234) TaxID=1703937 RepID=UPI001301348D|nr:hypothetical protein [Streptomyces sp. CB03234]